MVARILSVAALGGLLLSTLPLGFAIGIAFWMGATLITGEGADHPYALLASMGVESRTLDVE